ncbi:MAG: class II fructose-bisphosphate aldolase [Sulfurimicrobium sp.]|nr:class II fructose-bisphosphate aldolase [Sulfurimicrobium sp.]MDP2198234.1 class II fructose-bisphosphate aldolase [Sulfurimicrobium sp.]
MPLVNMKDLLIHAYRNGYAVGAFDLVSLDFLQAIMSAAESARAPVILSISESSFAHAELDLIMPAVEAAALRAKVPVAIHLYQGANLDSAVRAIRLGCNGVMVDASREPLFENINRTRAVVDMAHACGVAVEGELGNAHGMGGENDEHNSGPVSYSYTTVAEAKGYVERTGVDFLSVSVGTMNGRMKDKPKLEWSRLKEINAALGIPLAIHGGSGLSDDQYRKLITLGVAKINYNTVLSDVAGERIRSNAKQDRHGGYAALLSGIREAIQAEIEHCLRIWGSAGRAAEVSAQCRPWLNVEQVVVYNAPKLDEDQLRAMMLEGQRQLIAIPGVRAVQVGSVVDKSDRYRHCWLIRLASAAAIANYNKHPIHVAFAARQFHPAAADRIAADYCVAGFDHAAALLPLSAAPVAGGMSASQTSRL